LSQRHFQRDRERLADTALSAPSLKLFILGDRRAGQLQLHQHQFFSRHPDLPRASGAALQCPRDSRLLRGVGFATIHNQSQQWSAAD
jgi:hypothetical protein